MQLPEILTAEGHAAIIACLRIAVQMGETIEDDDKDTPAETMGLDSVDVPGCQGSDLLAEVSTDSTRASQKRRKRVIAP